MTTSKELEESRWRFWSTRPWCNTPTGRRMTAARDVARAQAAASATPENNTSNMDPAEGEKLKSERLLRGPSDALNTLGEEIVGKDDDICVGEDGAAETKHLPSGEDGGAGFEALKLLEEKALSSRVCQTALEGKETKREQESEFGNCNQTGGGA